MTVECFTGKQGLILVTIHNFEIRICMGDC